GVGEENDFSGGVQHSAANAVSFAAIGFIGEEAEVGAADGNRFHDLGGGVGRAVVNDEDFGAPGVSVDGANDLGEGRADTRLFVIGGNYDAVFDFHGRGLTGESWIHHTHSGEGRKRVSGEF